MATRVLQTSCSGLYQARNTGRAKGHVTAVIRLDSLSQLHVINLRDLRFSAQLPLVHVSLKTLRLISKGVITIQDIQRS